MNNWSKMMAALQNGINEGVDQTQDNEALLIIDQEVKEHSEELKRTHEAIGSVQMQKTQAAEELPLIAKQIVEYEGYAQKALAKNEEELVVEIAEQIVNLEQQRHSKEGLLQNLDSQAKNLRQIAIQLESNIKRLKQQADTIKAAESVQRAQTAVAERVGYGLKVRTAIDSMAQLKRKKQEEKTVGGDEVGSEVDGEDPIKSKLIRLGIISETHSASVEDIIQRIKRGAGKK